MSPRNPFWKTGRTMSSDCTEEYKVDEQPRCDRCCQSGWQPRGKQSLQPGFLELHGWFSHMFPYFLRRSHQNRGPWGPLAIQGFIMYSAATGPARSEKPMGHLKQSWNFGGGCEFWTFSCYPKSIYINLSKSDKADTNLKANFYPHEY